MTSPLKPAGSWTPVDGNKEKNKREGRNDSEEMPTDDPLTGSPTPATSG